MKITLFASSFPKEDIIKLTREASKEVTFLLRIIRKGEWTHIKSNEFGKNVKIFFDDNFSFSKQELSSGDELVDVLHYVLNDHQTIMFQDRTGLFIPWGRGVMNFTRYVTKVTSHYFGFLKTEQPDYVYFRSTPHQIESWICALVAEFLKVGVLVSETAPLPWRKSLALGFRKNRTLYPLPENLTQQNIGEETKRLEEYIKTNQSDYSIAIPDYEKNRLERNKGQYYDLFRDVLKWWKRPDFVLNKYKCYKACRKHSIVFDPKKPYVVFMPHYQPERTTLPEGFGFAQQMIAILALRAATPPEIEVVVKEHPSIFTNKCDPTQRHPSFYRDISEIIGVKLVDISTDPFSLIKSSLAVATITGTIGSQASLRGTPVIYFGKPKLFEGTGIHHFTSLRSLKLFIEDCARGISEEKIIQYSKDALKSSLHYSVSGKLTEDVHPIQNENYFAELAILHNLVSD